MKNVAFRSLLGWKMIILQILAPHLYVFSAIKGWENVLFKLRSERVNRSSQAYRGASHRHGFVLSKPTHAIDLQWLYWAEPVLTSVAWCQLSG